MDHASFLSAVQNGQTESVKTYISQGYDVNWLDPYGLSLLNYACHFGHIEIVDLLLNSGANVNYADPWGMTSLHAALKEGHDEVVQRLLAQGASVNASTTSGYYVGFTPLYTAIYFHKVQLSTLDLLLQSGADLEAVTAEGKTALQMALDNGWTEAETLLRQNGATR